MYFSYFPRPEDSPQKNTSIRNAMWMFKVDSKLSYVNFYGKKYDKQYSCST
jgi:hypothetical protein